MADMMHQREGKEGKTKAKKTRTKPPSKNKSKQTVWVVVVALHAECLTTSAGHQMPLLGGKRGAQTISPVNMLVCRADKTHERRTVGVCPRCLAIVG